MIRKSRKTKIVLTACLATFFVMTLMSTFSTLAVAKRNTTQVRNEQQQTDRDIATAKKNLTAKEKEIAGQLDRLEEIRKQIESRMAAIDSLNLSIEQTAARFQALSDTIAIMQYEDSILTVNVAKGLRQRHVQSVRMPALAFIAGAKNLTEAHNRLNHLNVTQRAKNKRVVKLRQHRQNLETARDRLDSLQGCQILALEELEASNSILTERFNEVNKLVRSLRSEKATLQKVLRDKNRRMEQLDAELDKLLAAEKKQKSNNRSDATNTTSSTTRGSSGSQSVASSIELTGSFRSNKGKLPFPVAGKYTTSKPFGTSQHPKHHKTMRNNNGIDISVGAGTQARCVFNGVVSGVFYDDKYKHIVVVRHGNYLTAYAGLASVSVEKGDKVKTGQSLGKIATIRNKTVLHFEVRNEHSKLNPMQWVK